MHKYKISDWGRDLEKMFTDIVDGKRGPLKSAAVLAAEARAGRIIFSLANLSRMSITRVAGNLIIVFL